MVIVVQKSYHPAVIDDQKVLIGALQWVWLPQAIETTHFLMSEGSCSGGAGCRTVLVVAQQAESAHGAVCDCGAPYAA
jgi:hypothetical protein